MSVHCSPRALRARGLALVSLFAGIPLVACGGSDPAVDRAADGITHRDEVTPVTDATKALPGVLVPPFVDCRDPMAGDTTTSADGKVCTNVSVAGATEPGKSFAAYASCDVVRTQRPVWPAPPASVPAEDDPRLQDAALLAELAWAKEEVAATGCQCCHDSGIGKGPASQWDLSAGPLWLDSLSDTGLALFTGLADSSVLGAYPADQNHGFDRTATGIPTTDTARMKALLLAELTRRGLTEDDARAVPPFGGPIYQNAIREPEACGPGQGISTDGRVLFSFGQARYVYVLEAGSANPGVPPNRDRPDGLVWRLDVMPNVEALESGLLYGKTPPGTFQDTPATGPAPTLVEGRTYHLSVLLDVGFPVTNCLFVYGQPITE